MHLKFYILVNLSICFFNVHAQKVDNDTLVNNMKSTVTKFFIEQNVLESNQIGSLNSTYVTEIKEGKALGYNIIGIYRIGVFQSHSKEHILIKENSQFKIFDIKEIDLTLRAVIDYSIKNKIEADIMLFYIKNIMDMYENNYKTIPNGGGLMKKVK